MNATRTTDPRWPALPVQSWHATRDTLQLWTQIIGKVRMANEAPINHWWNVALYVTARGFTSSLIPHPSGEGFEMVLDLQAHELDILTVSGARRVLPLRPGPVSDFYAAVMRSLDELDVPTEIWPMPVEIEGAVPLDTDQLHTAYEPRQAHDFWLALVQMVRVFHQFRSRFIGKASPVHLFWGGLDLAATRFSGRSAPPHPGGAPNAGPHVMLEAYSHEVSSCGYWAGGQGEGYFYSYAYPEPPGYKDVVVQPAGAFWSDDLQEFLLPYEQVRTASQPDRVLLDFLQTTYEAAAMTAHWDRDALERASVTPSDWAAPVPGPLRRS